MQIERSLAEKLFPLAILLVAGASSAHAQVLYTPGATIGNNTTTNNIGIGTATPTSKLTVDGGFIELRSGNDLMLRPTGNAWDYRLRAVGTRLDIISGGDLGNPKLSVEASGNVGIGTVEPSGRLDLLSDSPGSVPNLVLRSGQDRTPRIRFNGPWSVSNPGESYAQIIAQNDHGGPGTNATASLRFFTSSGDPAALSEKLVITGNGNVGIGTVNPTQRLSVNGTIRAKEVIVETTGWSDDVFAPGYRLAPLSEVEAHIKSEKHLPDIPSASEVAEQGVAVGDMQAKLLRKIEELTLHVIAQGKELSELKSENRGLRSRVVELETALQP